ncbi:MAG: UDP-N-acetylglucosamine 4,6-dehydratase [Planctomycetaceae bacterium]|nr:UDP-N-acetylglucosamine 4,6-dehydratase [Planctomycetaceae bacterium]
MENSELLKLIGRSEPLFIEDLESCGARLSAAVAEGRFLVIGGAGSIGSAVVRELFVRSPRVLHVIDISENNLAELVRGIRSSMGYIAGDFATYCFDVLGREFDAFIHTQLAAGGGYDYVLNFSALKHVRSEKDPFTLMRMINVNIFATLRTLRAAAECGARKFFCVSTDKAANPVNMMGASKRVMEMMLARDGGSPPVSTARFANVAFSDGSLPHSWRVRIQNRQPLSAPNDVRRYFVTDTEGAILCLFSMLLGENRDIFFPRLSPRLHLMTFADICERYVRSLGLEPVVCESEDEARKRTLELTQKKQWPCYFFRSDTTGEKDFEEFYTNSESVDWNRFTEIGIVKNDQRVDADGLQEFEARIRRLQSAGRWTRQDLVDLFHQIVPDFGHKETGRYLDNRM